MPAMKNFLGKPLVFQNLFNNENKNNEELFDRFVLSGPLCVSSPR